MDVKHTSHTAQNAPAPPELQPNELPEWQESLLAKDAPVQDSPDTENEQVGAEQDAEPAEEGVDTASESADEVAETYIDGQILLAQAELPPQTPEDAQDHAQDGKKAAGEVPGDDGGWSWWPEGVGVVAGAAGLGLIMSSGGGGGGTLDVNDAPTDLTLDNQTVAENNLGAIIGNLSVTDPDIGDSHTYIVDDARFEVVSGQLKLKAGIGLDFEADPSVTVSLTVTDSGGLSYQEAFDISVLDLNDNSPVFTSGATGTVAENAAVSTVIYDAAATDADAGDIVTYSLKAATGDVADLNINAATGEVTLKASADYEAKPSYSFTVIASDGTNSSEQAIVVSVSDLNDNTPTISSGGTGTVAENAVASTVIYDAVATDADGTAANNTITYSLKAATGDVADVNIDATTGEVTLKASADYEAKSIYSFTVIASDGINSSEQAVVVNVSDVNENPVITSNAAVNVAENTTAVTTVTATDVDVADTQAYSITGGADAAMFTIDPNTGALSFLSAPDFETPADSGTDNVYDVQVTVTDSGGLTDVQDLAVTVTDANEAPVITSDGGGATAAVSVAENTTAVTTVTATDVDAADTQAYSVTGGADAAIFTIDPNTGALSFLSAPDFENPADSGANNVYDVQVTVTDSGGLTDAQDIAVTVTDVAETVYTVVEQSGAWIDVNADGIRDVSETTKADFSTSGNADLAAQSVVVHFNDVPDTAIDLSGFTADDQIEIDVSAFNFVGNMVSSPAHSITSISTSASSYLWFTMDNGNYFSVFFQYQPGLTFTAPSHLGALAFYTNTTSFLAYWSDTANPLLDVKNIMPGVGTSAGAITTGTTAAISALNPGGAGGGLVDFIWPTPQTLTVVVEKDYAFIDANNNSILDAGETTELTDAALDIGFNHVTVHFNDVPNNPLDLNGFGSDDLIEIDVQSFIDNGHNLLQILSHANSQTPADILTLDQFTATGSVPYSVSGVTGTYSLIYSSSYSSTFYHISQNHLMAGPSGTTFSGQVYNYLSLYNSGLNFVSDYGPISKGGTLASGLPTSIAFTEPTLLQHIVDFVNLPVAPDTVHVVVEQYGAVIDTNGNGVRDVGENWVADFSSGGNADLAGKAVVIQYNDIPDSPLFLEGFDSNDLIEIDVQSLFAKGLTPAALLDPAITSTATTTALRTLDNINSYRNHTTLGGLQWELTTSNSNALFSELYSLRTPSGEAFKIHYFESTNISAQTLLKLHTATLGTSNTVTLGSFSQPPDTTHGSPPSSLLQNMVDFVNLPETIHVVVDQRGAFIDANADGILDAAELSNPANFDPGGNVVMGYDHVTIHYNDVPNGNSSINLQGFGTDDLIEIDIQAFIDNGHNVLQLLSRPTDFKTLDAFSTTGFFPFASGSNWLSVSSPTTSYGFTQSRNVVTSGGITFTTYVAASITLFGSSGYLSFYSYNGTAPGGWTLASGLPSNLSYPLEPTTLQGMVQFVNLPTAPETIHVVVDQYGAVIDYDGDGVHDAGENWLADFADGRNADLGGGTPVVIHFNEVPGFTLDLTGFSDADKIEIDAGDSWIAGFTVGASSVNYQLAHYEGPSSAPSTIITMIRVNMGGHSMSVSTTLPHNIATWSVSDSGNALNNVSLLLPDYNGSNTSAVLAGLNANHYAGLVEFVWPVHVVVDDQFGNVASFIDDNANGVHDAGENTLALIGQTQADADAYNAHNGTSYDVQVVDLASEQVTIHYNDLPHDNWTPDLTGFDGNDRIEIDIAAMKFGSDSYTLGTQITQTMGSATTVLNGQSGVTHMGNFAVYLDGSALKTGHVTTSVSYTLFGSTLQTHFTATAPSEGTLAIHVDALVHHYDQVAYVDTV